MDRRKIEWDKFPKYLLYPLVPLLLVIHRIFRKRKAFYILSLCDDNSKILDVGYDDGTIAKMLIDSNPSLEIVGVDVVGMKKSKIPGKIYDGKHIPYPDNYFDIVMIIDVLHHLKNIYPLLQEMRRVTKKYIIIKDHLISHPFDRIFLTVPDYVGYLFINLSSIRNYLSWEEWQNIFKKLKLRLVERIGKFSFGFGMNEKRNFIVKLEK